MVGFNPSRSDRTVPRDRSQRLQLRCVKNQSSEKRNHQWCSGFGSLIQRSKVKRPFGLIGYQVIGSVLAEYHSHRCQLAVLDFMVSIPYRYENSGFTGQQVTGDLVHPSRFKSKYCKTEIDFVLDLIY